MDLPAPNEGVATNGHGEEQILGQDETDQSPTSNNGRNGAATTQAGESDMWQNILAARPRIIMYPHMVFSASPYLNVQAPYNDVVAGTVASNTAERDANAPNDNADERQDRPVEVRALIEREQLELLNRNGGYQYKLAPIWKRFCAQALDAAGLVQLGIYLETFGIFMFNYLRNTDLEEEQALMVNSHSFDWFMMKFIVMILLWTYESFWITVWGATLGKIVFKLRVLHVEAVLPIPPQPQPEGFLPTLFQGIHSVLRPMNVLVFPAQKPKFRRSFMRTILKNLITADLLPLSGVYLFFKRNRTPHDVLTKTIVVEAN